MENFPINLSYHKTGFFSKIILDYLDQSDSLQPFYKASPSVLGIKEIIESREAFKTDRKKLVACLKEQYKSLSPSAATVANIDSLLQENTFTVTTAHQNNIFTGPLYFIYKILHVIKLADSFTTLYSGYNFVPVYWMGSEDADLNELNHIQVAGEKLVWNTDQQGAVGRMKVDDKLLTLIDTLEAQVGVLPYGGELVQLLRNAYIKDRQIDQATFQLVNELFQEYGLVIILPDTPALKSAMIPVFEDELLHHRSAGIVQETGKKMVDAGYKMQAHAREINLFYLQENSRERVEAAEDGYKIVNSTKTFTKEEIFQELHAHPERFSPNVILRGLYQTTVLPDVAFVGGGGELAYWLQLKELFAHYKVPYPALILRNSFLVLTEKYLERINKSKVSIEDVFLPETELMNAMVTRESSHSLVLDDLLTNTENVYEKIKERVRPVDATLLQHVNALQHKAVEKLHELEKKILKAEKRKYTDLKNAIAGIKADLFPHNSLQERVENLAYFYSLFGKDFIQQLHQYSNTIEQQFQIVAVQ